MKMKHMRTLKQIMADYHCDLAKAKDLVKGKPSCPHPDAPDDEDFVLYKVWGGETEADTTAAGCKDTLAVEAEVNPENAAAARGLLEGLSGTPFPAMATADDDGQGAGSGAGLKRKDAGGAKKNQARLSHASCLNASTSETCWFHSNPRDQDLEFLCQGPNSKSAAKKPKLTKEEKQNAEQNQKCKDRRKQTTRTPTQTYIHTYIPTVVRLINKVWGTTQIGQLNLRVFLHPRKEWSANLSEDARQCAAVARGLQATQKKQLEGHVTILHAHVATLKQLRPLGLVKATGYLF